MKMTYYFEAEFDGDVQADSPEEAENLAHQLIYDKVRSGSFKIKLEKVED